MNEFADLIEAEASGTRYAPQDPATCLHKDTGYEPVTADPFDETEMLVCYDCEKILKK